MREVASHEDEIFARRARKEERIQGQQRERAAAQAIANGGAVEAGAFGNLYPPRDPTQRRLHDQVKAFSEAKDGPEELVLDITSLNGFHMKSLFLYIELLSCIKAGGAKGEPTVTVKRKKAGGPARQSSKPTEDSEDLDFETRLKLRIEAADAALATADVDEVRFGSGGWKGRYYAQKLWIGRGDAATTRYVSKCYVEGLCWVLMYYYQGVQDWGWFYPFHYAPCASDLTNLQEFAGGQWELGAPFLPFTQLMAVFPPASGHALPKAYRQLMVTPNSPIIDFYPIDFKNDLNGKRHQWQAISLLPFIDAARLRAALAPLLPTLTAEEAGRNAFSSELLFTNTRSALGARCAKCAAKAGDADADEKPLALSPTSDESPGFGGEVRPAARLRRADAPLPPPPGGAAAGLEQVAKCDAVGVKYAPPEYSLHSPRLLPGVTLPPSALQPHDKPKMSRDGDEALRTMMSKFYGGGGAPRGRGGGGRGGGGGGRDGKNAPAHRMIAAALPLGR